MIQNSHSNNFQIFGIWETKYKVGLYHTKEGADQ